MYIQEFSVGNYKSFKEINTLSLMSTKSVSAFSEVDDKNLFSIEDSDVKLMKTKAIYGANSSGKSNIIKALSLFIKIVKDSVVDKSALSDVDYFRLSSTTEEEPSFFQLIFWEKNTRYRYGFEVDKEKVHSEWLYHKPNKREEPLFIREGLKIIEVNKSSFIEGDTLLNLFDIDKEETGLFRTNSLVLTTLSTFGLAKVSSNIIKAIASINVISGLGNYDLIRGAENRLDNEEVKSYILNILKFGDIGINNIDFITFGDDDGDNPNESSKVKKKKSEERFVYSLRPKFDENDKEVGFGVLPFSYESEGTKKLFEIAPCIYEAFKKETPLVIDEFDARFHPLLTREIIRLFNSKNKVCPQLIFTTHDTNLLDNKIFRKDQIDFVEKDSFGASHLYSLIEFKGLRNTSSFEDDYIKGKFGAIPYLGDFTKLIDLVEYGEED